MFKLYFDQKRVHFIIATLVVVLISSLLILINIRNVDATSIKIDTKSGEATPKISGAKYEFKADSGGSVSILATGGIFQARDGGSYFTGLINSKYPALSATDGKFTTENDNVIKITTVDYKCIFGPQGFCIDGQSGTETVTIAFSITVNPSDITNNTSNPKATLSITSINGGTFGIYGKDLRTNILKDMGGKDITISGSPKSATKTTGNVQAEVNISNIGKMYGTYGPITIDLKNSSNDQVLKQTTSSKVIDSNSVLNDGTLTLKTTDNFTGLDPSLKYSACIDGTNYCNNGFTIFSAGTFTADIDITADQADASGLFKESTSSSTACAINGIGWIVCPTVNFLSYVADQAFSFLADNFLTISPKLLNTDKESGAYKAWNMIRMLANAILVIAFLVIIYSQISGFGISNYGIKRMLPRLIIIAILINISYIICRLCIDLSDILGYSLKSVLGSAAGITQVTTNSLKSSWSTGSGFSGVAGTVLGGTAATATAVAASGGVTLALVAFLGVLIAAVIALIMIFFILTIRQVVIILLVVLSPLAIAAYLFPNTESLAKKWVNIFRDMLLLFPIIGLVYGGSSLASSIIKSAWQSSGSDNTLVEVIGAAVLVLPLFVVPVLLKGSIKALGSIGEKINGVGAKLSGAARNGMSSSQLSQYAKSKNQEDKMRALAGNYRGYNPLRRTQSWAHSHLNSTRPYNVLTRGFGASQYLANQAQNRKDMTDTIANFSNDDDVIEAYARTGGDLGKLQSMSNLASGNNYASFTQAQKRQLANMRASGLHQKPVSYLAAVSAMSSSGKGSLESVTEALANAKAQGATDAEIDSSWQSSIAAYRNSGRGDMVGQMKSFNSTPIGSSSITSANTSVEKMENGWNEISPSSIHRDALKPGSNSEKSYSSFISKNRNNLTQALSGYNQMDARTKTTTNITEVLTSAAKARATVEAQELSSQEYIKMVNSGSNTVDASKRANAIYGDKLREISGISDIQSAKNYFGIR